MDSVVIIWLIMVFMILVSIASFVYYLLHHNKDDETNIKEQELLAQTLSQVNKKDSK